MNWDQNWIELQASESKSKGEMSPLCYFKVNHFFLWDVEDPNNTTE